MILSKAARTFAKQSGFFSINKLSQPLTINASKRLYSTESPKNEKKVDENKVDEKKEEEDNDKGNSEDKPKDKESQENGEEKEKEKKKERKFFGFRFSSQLQSLGAGSGAIIITSALFGLFIFNYKKDITEDERNKLSVNERRILDKVTSIRTHLENIHSNLSDRSEVYRSLFGKAEIFKILPPQLPGSKKLTLVVDIDALSELSKLSKYPTIYKRAGLDFFLENLKKDYDIYLFFNSNVPHDKVEQLYFKLDPNQQYFVGQIYADHGLKDRHQFSEFSNEMLDRDPSKVVLLDASAPYRHSNVINVGKFHSNSKDTILIELLPVLLSFAKNKVDVRNEIKGLQDIENDSLSTLITKYSQEHHINPIIKKVKSDK